MRLIILAFSSLLFATSPLLGQIEDFPQTDFKKADSIAQLYPDHSLADLKGLSDKLTSPLPSDVEKFRALYTWVCLNIDNDYRLFYKNQHNRKKLSDNPEALDTWNKKFSIVVFKTLRNKRSTVCTGYAYLLRELALYAGISCLIVDGYGRTAQSNIGGEGIPNHSWTAVQLNNKWYLCDATWSSGAIDTQEKKFVKHYNDIYFLLDPELFIRNHYPQDTTKMLLQNGPTLTEFLNRPLIYNSIFQYNIKQLRPETFEVTAKKGEPVFFEFSKNDRVIEMVELSIKGPGGISSIRPSFQQDASGLTSIAHTFTMKGTHIVHVLLNNSYAFTYTIKVIKE
jgi:transglutaminase/protease-like cytokinesis protein 3